MENVRAANIPLQRPYSNDIPNLSKMRASGDDKVMKIDLIAGKLSSGHRPAEKEQPRISSPRELNLTLSAFSGTVWLVIGKIYRQLLFLVRATVLARLLSPQDFGLVGLGELCIQLLGVFSYTWFRGSASAKTQSTPEDFVYRMVGGCGQARFYMPDSLACGSLGSSTFS